MTRGLPKSCGKKGRRYRTFLRDLVQGREIERKDALKAVFHVEECDYCRVSIELAIHRAEKERRRTDYLESFGYTLQEARMRLASGRIGKERNRG